MPRWWHMNLLLHSSGARHYPPLSKKKTPEKPTEAMIEVRSKWESGAGFSASVGSDMVTPAQIHGMLMEMERLVLA